jgi:hypothetical protein
VDVYVSGAKKMYVLAIPDEKNRKGIYELILKGAKTATIYNLQAGSDAMISKNADISSGRLKVDVTETPVFVQAN